MQPTGPLEVVQAWQDAANACDVDRLLALSAPTIEMVGPRGAGVGHQLLREWLARAGLTLTTLRRFARGNVVVLEQRGTWRALDTGDMTGERTLASAFEVDDRQQVARFARYDSLGEALSATRLGNSDEVR